MQVNVPESVARFNRRVLAELHHYWKMVLRRISKLWQDERRGAFETYRTKVLTFREYARVDPAAHKNIHPLVKASEKRVLRAQLTAGRFSAVMPQAWSVTLLTGAITLAPPVETFRTSFDIAYLAKLLPPAIQNQATQYLEHLAENGLWLVMMLVVILSSALSMVLVFILLRLLLFNGPFTKIRLALWGLLILLTGVIAFWVWYPGGGLAPPPLRGPTAQTSALGVWIPTAELLFFLLLFYFFNAFPILSLRRSHPDALVVSVLSDAVIMVGREPKSWSNLRAKVELMDALERIARILERDIPRHMRTNDVHTDTWIQDRMVRTAAAVREFKKWVSTPQGDTRTALHDALSPILRNFAMGEWHYLPEVDPPRLTRWEVR